MRGGRPGWRGDRRAAESEHRAHVPQSAAAESAGAGAFAANDAAGTESPAVSPAAGFNAMTGGEQPTRGLPGYGVLVLIGWKILWQTVGSFLLLLFLANIGLLALLPELTRSGPSWWALLSPLLVVTVMVALLVMPVVVRALFTTSFAGYRLQLLSDQGVPGGGELSESMTARRSSADDTQNRHPGTRADDESEPSGHARPPGRG